MTCSQCNSKLSYNEHYDADFCATCDRWVSSKCGATDPHDCGFDCQNRPDKPSQVDPDKR